MGRKTKTLNGKIISIVFATTIIVSAVIGMILYRYFSTALTERVQRDNQIRFEQVLDELDELCYEAVRFAQQISIDSTVQSFLSQDDYASVVEEMSQRREISNYLTRIKTLSTSIDSIALVRGEQVEVWTSVPFWDDSSRALCQDWYAQFRQAVGNQDSGRQQISEHYRFSFASQKGMQQMHYISLQVPLYSMEQADLCIGSLVVNISVDAVQKILDKNSAGFDGLGYLCCDTELFAAAGSTMSEDELRQTAQQGEDRKDFPICFSAQTALGGTLVSAMEYPSSMQTPWSSVRSMLPILLAAGILILVLLIPIMLHLTRPVAVLADAMKRVGAGDMRAQVQIRTNDEFEVLGNELNRMVQKLDNYIQATLQNEKDKHDLEYEVLVAQINPHFIYNTLNTVIYLAKKERHQDVVRITRALIDLLQDGIKLSDNKNFSTVEEELWIIENYVCIQNYRYQDKFELIVECPEQLKGVRVPSSVIQPLVENALFHGIVPLERRGRIWLRLCREERNGSPWIHISVADDGVGIEQEKINDIMEGRLQVTEVSRNHVGVQNIRKRLALLYADEYEFRMSSCPSQGTQAEVLFPEELAIHTN